MKAVDVAAVLAARDRRYARQQALRARFGAPLISFTMNIAGEVKRWAQVDRAFELTLRRLEAALQAAGAPVLHRETVYADTGCEALYAVDAPAEKLKELCVALEEQDALGRLLDLDVLDTDGRALTRGAERPCLLCGGPGRICARSRAHTVQQLRQRTEEILCEALLHHDGDRAAELAVRALLWEACTAPKPGLVDRLGSGSHSDMDIFTFMSSAAALQPYFARCTELGRRTAALPPRETLQALRLPGMLAEDAMLRATGGVNTHKGAVFLLGLACGALGRLDRALWAQPHRVLDECAAMAAGITAELETGCATAGGRLYRRCGLRGIRGEAEAGFPSVRRGGLPALQQALARGADREEAGCLALVRLMSLCEDTALAHRVGCRGWQQIRDEAAALWAQGPTRQMLEDFGRALEARNASPGGSADLLALCWLLHFLQQE